MSVKILVRCAVIGLTLLLATAVFADDMPGAVDSGSTDPSFDLYEGVTNYLTVLGVLPFPIISGDVILCEPGSVSCNSKESNWSDVVVFSNNFLTDTAVIYSDDDGTLASFLSGGFTPSHNAVYLVEDPSGVTDYQPLLISLQAGNGIAVDYTIHSAEGVPEPSSLALLFGALGSIGLAVRRRAA